VDGGSSLIIHKRMVKVDVSENWADSPPSWCRWPDNAFIPANV
jgi:hypothetical protein